MAVHEQLQMQETDFYGDDTRWFKYDWNICGLFTQKSVPVIFEPPCIFKPTLRW